MDPMNPHAQQFPSDFGPSLSEDPSFDLVTWYPAYQSCQRYFVNHAQHVGMVQCVASFINIRLPYQWKTPMVQLIVPPNTDPITMPSSSSASSSTYFSSGAFPARQPSAATPQPSLPFISLMPYIRRLIVTGFDNAAILVGFFGKDWERGIGPLLEIERRNYMFAAKSVGWAKVKYQYDMTPDETVPFMKPLQRVQLGEIERAEKSWSEWLAMEDWMVGPRAPPEDRPMTSASERGFRREGHRDDMVQDS